MCVDPVRRTSLTSSNEDRCAASLVPPVQHVCPLTVHIAKEIYCDILAFAVIIAVMMVEYGQGKG